jgi:hypothetical protein
MRRTSLALGAVAAALLVPASAQADVFAAVTVVAASPRTDFDVAVLNASTGARAALPAGINTADDEIHPTISTDGRRLAFQRRNLGAGTDRIVVVDLKTGQSSDLFNGFEAAQRPPGEPAIAPDGSKVVVGGPLTQRDSISYFADLIATDLAPFPAGPYTHTTIRPQSVVHLVGTVDDTVVGGDGLMAYAINDVNQQLVLMQPDGTVSAPQGSLPISDANPALAADHPTIVAFDQRRLATDLQHFTNGDIVFRPATVAGFVGTPTALPAIVNTAFDERQPAFTPDERYLAFVRDSRGNHASLFVWDSQTQTLLNPVGVDLGTGADTARDVGSVSLFFHPLIKASKLGPGGLFDVSLLGPSGIGIIVQRILGTHRVLGKKGFKLGPARRVPLGTFAKGRHGIRWDLKVGGRRLKPGRYLVTVRGVTPKAVVRELGRPHVIRVR